MTTTSLRLLTGILSTAMIAAAGALIFTATPSSEASPVREGSLPTEELTAEAESPEEGLAGLPGGSLTGMASVLDNDDLFDDVELPVLPSGDPTIPPSLPTE